MEVHRRRVIFWCCLFSVSESSKSYHQQGSKVTHSSGSGHVNVCVCVKKYKTLSASSCMQPCRFRKKTLVFKKVYPFILYFKPLILYRHAVVNYNYEKVWHAEPMMMINYARHGGMDWEGLKFFTFNLFENQRARYFIQRSWLTRWLTQTHSQSTLSEPQGLFDTRRDLFKTEQTHHLHTIYYVRLCKFPSKKYVSVHIFLHMPPPSYTCTNLFPIWHTFIHILTFPSKHFSFFLSQQIFPSAYFLYYFQLSFIQPNSQHITFNLVSKELKKKEWWFDGYIQ